MEQAAQVVGVQAVQVAWQVVGVMPVDDVRVPVVVPDVAADRAFVARQDVPVAEAAEVPDGAAGRVVANVKQVDWRPGVPDRGHSVCSKEFDPN